MPRVRLKDIPNVMFIEEHLSGLTPRDAESIQEIVLIDTTRPIRSAFMLAQGPNRDCMQILLFESERPDFDNAADVVARPYIHKSSPGHWGPGLRSSTPGVELPTANTFVSEPVYYVFRDSDAITYGPITDIMLREWLRAGCIQRTDKVCTAGETQWTEIQRSRFV